MISNQRPLHRAFLTAVTASCVALVCAGCSIPAAPANSGSSSGGDKSSSGNSNSSSGSNGGQMSDSEAAEHYGNTGGSVEEACKAFLDSEYDDAEDESGVAKYWDGVAKAAPQEIQSKVFAIAQVMDKVANGDISGLENLNQDDVTDVTHWMNANCK